MERPVGYVIRIFANAGQHRPVLQRWITALTSSSIVSKSIAKVAEGRLPWTVTFNKSQISFSIRVWHHYHGWLHQIRFHLMKSTTHKLLWSTKPRFQKSQKSFFGCWWVSRTSSQKRQKWLSWDLARALYKRTSNGIRRWVKMTRSFEMEGSNRIFVFNNKK